MKSKIFATALSIFSFTAATVSAQVPENVTVNDNTLPKQNTPSTNPTTDNAPKGKVKKNFPRPNGQANKDNIPTQRPSKKPETGGQPSAEGKQHKEHHDGDMDKNEKGEHKEGEMRKNKPEGEANGRGGEMRKNKERGEDKMKGKKPEGHKNHDKGHDKDHDKEEKSGN